MRHTLLIILALVGLCSCSTVRTVSMVSEYEGQFIGHDGDYIVTVCGEPSSTLVSKSGKVLVYNDIEAFSRKSGIAISSTVDGGEYNLEPYVQFFLNSDDLCYSVRTNHVREVKEFDAKKSWVVVASSVGGSAVACGIVGLIIGILSRK